MLSRFITRPSSHLRLLTLISSPTTHFSTPKTPFSNPRPNSIFPQSFSTNRNNNGNDHPTTPKIDLWNLSTDNEEEESVFEDDAAGGATLDGIYGVDSKPPPPAEVPWLRSPAAEEDDIFKGVEKEVEVGGRSAELPATGDGGAWSLGGGEEKIEDVFGLGDDDGVLDVREVELGERVEIGRSEEERKLEEEKVEEERRLKEEEKKLLNVLKGKLPILHLSILLGLITHTQYTGIKQ